MKEIKAKVLSGISVGILLLAGEAWFFPFSRAPLGLHKSYLPVACAGYSCVTYASLSRAISEDSADLSVEEILTALLERKSVKTVAKSENIIISRQEIAAASASAREALENIPGAMSLITYNQRLSLTGKKFDDEIKYLLLMEKMSVLGLRNIWESKSVPTVVVFNKNLFWNDDTKKISVR